jgi:hypothetical protein
MQTDTDWTWPVVLIVLWVLTWLGFIDEGGQP